MRNCYPHKSNGLPIMGIADLNDFAIRILQEYAPETLERPMALDIKGFAEDKLYLDVQDSPMYFESLLGLIAYSDVKLPIDREKYICVNEGTIVINDKLINNPSRWRFTAAHEVSHWILHRGYCDKTGHQYEFRKGDHSYVAVQDDLRELGKKNPIVCTTDDDWTEWQADYLAASLLMPGPSFIKVAKQIMDVYNFPKHQLISGQRVDDEKKVVAALANIYKVSYRSIRLRLRNFGMYLGDS